MNIFQYLFRHLVYDPQLNALQIFFNITGDVGVAIILLAALVNLLLWPVMASSYINSQKIRILQPKLKEIQEKYKDNQQELLKQTIAFNKKHKISSGSVFLVLFVQLFFASGLYFVINDVTLAVNDAGKAAELLNHLYDFTKNLPKTSFSSVAFGFLEITSPIKNWLIILPLLNLAFSHLTALYSFKFAPKLPVPKVKPASDKPSALDPEALQKSLEFNSLYLFPAVIFATNLWFFPAGLNLYFTTTGLISLIRQVSISKYYSKHMEKLLADVAESDPTSDDNNPDNNIDSIVDVEILANQPASELVLPKSSKNKSAKTKTSYKKAKKG